MKEFLIQRLKDCISRKFLCMIVGVLAFCFSKKFDSTALIAVMGLYVAGNVVDKYLNINNTGGTV